MKKKETKVVCPVCGAEFAIGEHEHQVKNAIVIGKDSGLGTIELPLAQKKTKAQLRIDQLKAKGIDTSKMYAMLGNDGREKIGVTTKKGFEVVDVDDNIERILRGGTINTSHLFKQHVLAQMLRGLTNENWNYKKRVWVKETDRFGYPTLDNGHYCKYIWYDYSWDVLNDELMRQSAMWRHGDMKSFNEDNRWYNKELAVEMAYHYYDLLGLLLHSMKVHKCKGKQYIKYKGAEDLSAWFTKRSARGYLYRSEFKDFLWAVHLRIVDIEKASTPISLHHAVEEFCKVRPTLYVPSGELREDFKPQIWRDWLNAYKGYGAYFSMQNLILFHDCKIHMGDGDILGKKSSMEMLETWAEEHKDDAYWLIGALKQLLRTNNFDIEAKQKEWAAKYK